MAAVRSGQGLLTRLLRCGRCGRKLHIRYWGRAGTAARYACLGDYDSGGSYCLAFGGSTVDRRFAEELLKVISPLGMRASLRAVELRSREESDERQALERALQEAQYEVHRAFEQYDEVDPRNRLVAAELEQRWNAKLEKVETLRSSLGHLEERPRPLTDREGARCAWSRSASATESPEKGTRTDPEIRARRCQRHHDPPPGRGRPAREEPGGAVGALGDPPLGSRGGADPEHLQSACAKRASSNSEGFVQVISERFSCNHKQNQTQAP